MNTQFNRELDDLLQTFGRDGAEIDGLFAISDVLASQYRVRASLSDSTLPAEARATLAHRLFDGKANPKAVEVLAVLAKVCESSSDLEDQVERQAARATLVASGEVDTIQDELFKTARMIEADHALLLVLRDSSIPVKDRQELVASIIGERYHPQTVRLAQRAVLARHHTLIRTLDSYVELAAEIKAHHVAEVTMAAQPTSAQLDRLREQLARIYGTGVDVQVRIDPSVIGGGRVAIGDDVIDATIQRKMDEVRQRIGE